MATNHYVTDGALGIDLNYINSARNHTLGETHMSDGGGCFIFVRFESSTNQGALCKIDTGYLSSHASGANLASADSRLGFAQTAYAASQYGFLALAGENVLVRLTGGMAGGGGQPLYTTDTAGNISTASVSASQFQIFGVWVHSSASASGTTATVVTAAVQFAHLRKPRAGGG